MRRPSAEALAVAAALPIAAALVLALTIAGPPARAGTGADAGPLWAEHCATCHGADRLGGMGPALLPENLSRLRQDGAASVIADGRTATQMPAFGDLLDESEIEALVGLIYTPPDEPPVWGLAEIAASRIDGPGAAPGALPDAPVFDADPLNLFVVVEAGDHHVSILDGDSFERIERFPSRFALHGGPKFSPDGRFVHFASRDGWITRYDLWGLQVVAEVRAGINTRNLAISGDGRFLAVANYLPHSLVILNAADLSVLRVIPALDYRGENSSRVSAVYQAAPRNSFVVALRDIPEMWEVSWLDDPPPGYSGLVHSWERGMVEAIPDAAVRFPVRHIELSGPLDDFFLSPDYTRVIGAARDRDRGVVVHLDVRQEIAELPLAGMPHLGSGITWAYEGRRVMATPHLGEAMVSVIDMDDWSVIRTIPTLGPGFFMRSHENSRYAWVDVFFGENRDALHVIDKQTLEIVATLRPEPGSRAAHVEFTRDGRYALVSIMETDGAIVVYDAETLEEVTRIPMVHPLGKYNVWNKITLSEGTSH